MSFSIRGQSKWPLCNAALVSDTNNIYMNMREIVRALGWRMDDPPSRPDIALSYLESGSSFLFVIEDSVTSPAYESIRTITKHPAGRLTPLFVLLLDSSIPDRLVYERILNVAITKKPLTPSLFVPAFRQFVRLWESPLNVALRKCSYMILNGNESLAEEALRKMSSAPQAAPYTVPTLIRMYAKNHRWKEAETFLLTAMKDNPKSVALLLAIADFYAEARMPAQALRFYLKLKNISKLSPIFAFDIAQVALSLGQLDMAQEALSEWSKLRPNDEITSQHLARLYLAEGKDQEIDRISGMSKLQAKRIQELWEQSESPQPAHIAQPSAS